MSFRAVSNFENMASNMSYHTYPSTIPPIRFGIKNIVLNILVPLIFCVSASATRNARTFISTSVTIANNVVNLNASGNVASLNASI